MLGLIGNLQFSELAIVAIIAILIFGKRLPQVAGQAAAHVGRARRTLEGLWRETGIEDEVRKVKREIDQFERKLPRKLTPGELARKATEAVWKDIEQEPAPGGDAADEAAQPDGSKGSETHGAPGPDPGAQRAEAGAWRTETDAPRPEPGVVPRASRPTALGAPERPVKPGAPDEPGRSSEP